MAAQKDAFLFERRRRVMKKNSTNILIVYYLPAILWMGLIFYFSSMPGLTVVQNSVEADAVVRKLGHMFEFSFLAFLIYRILKERILFSVLKSLFYGSVLSLMYAAIDEFHQKFVPFREGTFRDWTFDFVGIVVFILIFYLVKKN